MFQSTRRASLSQICALSSSKTAAAVRSVLSLPEVHSVSWSARLFAVCSVEEEAAATSHSVQVGKAIPHDPLPHNRKNRRYRAAFTSLDS